MKFALKDTIAAIATPPGRGGIGVIRLSGDDAVKIAGKLFKPSSKKKLSGLPTHTLCHGWIRSGNEIVDEVMAAVMLEPGSYTGENTVEISAHGGPVVLSKILNLCLDSGARLAERGEFTFRAFVNRKMDLAKAESVAELINSRTELTLQSSVKQLQGTLSAKIEAFRSGLVDLLSKVEAALDHAEEGLEFISRKALISALNSLSSEILALLSTASKGQLLRDGVNITTLGKPNSGKSSLLNAFLERDRAIVTDIPGTTRDVLEEALDLRGLPVVLSDTAGIREGSKDLPEKIGQEKTWEAVKSSDLVLWLVDGSKKLSSEDRVIANLLINNGYTGKTIVLLNKSDLPAAVNVSEVRKLLPECGQCIKISATKKTNFAKLEDAIISFAKITDVPKDSPIIICLRHKDVLNRVLIALKDSITAAKKGESEEFVAFHMRAALNSLGEITGETATEEILENIFSNFCVGK